MPENSTNDICAYFLDKYRAKWDAKLLAHQAYKGSSTKLEAEEAESAHRLGEGTEEDRARYPWRLDALAAEERRQTRRDQPLSPEGSLVRPTSPRIIHLGDVVVGEEATLLKDLKALASKTEERGLLSLLAEVEGAEGASGHFNPTGLDAKRIRKLRRYLKRGRGRQEQNPNDLDLLLSDKVVFHSPLVHTPQVGKALTTH